MIIPSLAYRTICIVLLSQQPFNKQYIALVYYCIHFYVHMFSYDIMQPYTLVRPIQQGLKHPITWCEKTEHSHECGTPNL